MSQSALPSEESPLLSALTDQIPAEAAILDEDSNNASNQTVTRLRGCGICLSLCVLIFFQAANFSILTTTQSTIAADLDAFAEATWFTSSYLIAMSSVSPLAGRLSQIFSPRYCITVAAMVFALGTFVTSRAAGLAIFLVGRVITGIGAAGVLTLSIILVIELSSKQRRGLFIGLVNTAVTIGVSLGAVIGGALVDVTGWKALFWMQSPLVCAGAIGIFISVPASFSGGNTMSDQRSLLKKLRQIDYLGAILLTGCLVTLLTGLSSPKILYIPIAVAIGLLVLFILNEVHLASDPVIPVTLLKSRGALLTCLSHLGFMMARWMVLFYTPVYALAVRGWAPATAGSILIPTNAGFALGGLLAGALHIRRTGSFYAATLVSFVFFPATLLVLAEVSTRESSVYVFVAATFVNGFATGAALNYTLAHLLHLTPTHEHFIATSLLATFRGFAGSFGSAIGGGIFIRILTSSLEEGFADADLDGRESLIKRLLGSPALVKTLVGVEKDIAIQGYSDAVRGLFLSGVGLAGLMILVQAGTGWKGAAETEIRNVQSTGSDSIEEVI